jgi:hypothetical protein
MSKRAVLLTVFTVTAMLALAFTVFAQSAEPWIGTWKINLEKSKYSPGPPPKSFIRKVEPSERGLKETSDVVRAQGQTMHMEAIAKFDGKDYPVKGAAVANATRAYKRIDDRTVEFVGQVDGKVNVTIRTVHSADGKTSTSTVMGTNAQGGTVNNTEVWDRQ